MQAHAGRTPVVISGKVEWISGREWLDRNVELQAALERWRSDWEDLPYTSLTVRAHQNEAFDLMAELAGTRD